MLSTRAVLSPRADRVPAQAAVLGALAGARMLPAIWFIFSRAGCDRAAAATATGGAPLASAEERAQIAAEVDALRCALGVGLGMSATRSSLVRCVIRGGPLRAGTPCAPAGRRCLWRQCLRQPRARASLTAL